jgi:ABC-type methionine transport system ATPase subunit
MSSGKRALYLIFPQELIREPVIYRLCKKFDVAFSIRRAKVTEKVGEMVLEFTGKEAVIEKAVSWLKKKGIRVEPVTRDAVES